VIEERDLFSIRRETDVADPPGALVQEVILRVEKAESAADFAGDR